MRSWTIPERLPALQGWWLKLFTVFWLVWLAVAVIGITGSTYLGYQQFVQAPFAKVGINVWNVDGTARINGVMSREAQNSGIAYWDRIIAIDGAAVPESDLAHSWVRQKVTVEEGTAIVLTVRSQDGEVREHILHRREAHVAEVYEGTGLSPQPFAILLTALAGSSGLILIISSILLFPRRKEPVAALLSLSFLIIASFSGGALTTLFWEQTGFPIRPIFQVLGGICLTVGILLFPDGKFNPRWSFWIMLVTIGTLPLGLLYSEGSAVPTMIFLLALGAALLVLGLRYRRLSMDSERQQLRWAFFGSALTGLFTLVSSILVILWFSPFGAQPFWHITLASSGQLFATLATLCGTGGLIISLLKYRLYDANIIISRSAAYGTLTLGFIAIFAGSEKIIELIGQRYFEDSIGLVAGGVGAAIAALLMVPLHNRVIGWAERRFQRELVSMRDDLPETLGYLRETADEERLLASSLEQIASGVRATRSAVLVIEEQGLRVAATRETTAKEVEAWQRSAALDPNTDDIIRDQSDPLFPARLPLREAAGETPIGWLLLGPRPDGSFFGKDEREALFTLTKPIARALKIVQVRNRREEAIAKSQTKVAGQFTKISGQIKGMQKRILVVEKKL